MPHANRIAVAQALADAPWLLALLSIAALVVLAIAAWLDTRHPPGGPA